MHVVRLKTAPTRLQYDLDHNRNGENLGIVRNCRHQGRAGRVPGGFLPGVSLALSAERMEGRPKRVLRSLSEESELSRFFARSSP